MASRQVTMVTASRVRGTTRRTSGPLPYCLAILLAWTALLRLWIWLDIPLGPAGPLHYLRP